MIVDQVARPEHEGLRGRRIGELAAETGKAPFDCMIDLALSEELRTSFMPAPIGDDDASWKLRAKTWRDPRAIVGASDAGAHLDMIDTFAFSTRLLGAARERSLLPLEQAVQCLTDAPARLYGLRERGRLERGWHADVVVFDPARVASGPVHFRRGPPGRRRAPLRRGPRHRARARERGPDRARAEAHGRAPGDDPPLGPRHGDGGGARRAGGRGGARRAMSWLALDDPRERLLGRALRRQAELRPEAPFLRADARVYSFGEVNALANACAAGLRGLGVGRGDSVALLMESTPECVVVALGANKLGAVWVPANTDYKGVWLREALEGSRARVLVADAALLPRVAELGALPFEHVVVRGGAARPAAGDDPARASSSPARRRSPTTAPFTTATPPRCSGPRARRGAPRA